MKRILALFLDSTPGTLTDGIALLFLRVSAGMMMLWAHGLDKAQKFSVLAEKFKGYYGMSGKSSLVMAIFAELVCSGLLVIGLGTRFAALSLCITMATAAFLAHANDPFGVKEKALLYLVIFIVLAWKGAGVFSLDAIVAKRLRSGSK